MTVHRPHPITGPYPYATRDATGQVVPRHPWADAHAVPLAERVPIEGSEIYDDPDDAVLYDGCDRCAEHARGVWTGSVDAERLGTLWRRMVAVERGDGGEHYPTVTEAQACRTLYQLACFVEHTHPQLDPWSWPWHIRMGGVSVALTDGVQLAVDSIRMGDTTLPMPGTS